MLELAPHPRSSPLCAPRDIVPGLLPPPREESSDTASSPVLTCPPRDAEPSAAGRTLIIRPNGSAGPGNFTPGPRARRGAGEKEGDAGGTGAGGRRRGRTPYSQPCSKIKVRVCMTTGLRGTGDGAGSDASLRFPPGPSGFYTPDTVRSQQS